MCNPFFHDFRVIPLANGFQPVCYTATLCTTEAAECIKVIRKEEIRESAAWNSFFIFFLDNVYSTFCNVFVEVLPLDLLLLQNVASHNVNITYGNCY